MFSRRDLLRMTTASAVAGWLGALHTARAGTATENLVVVFAPGGWDPTVVFDAKPGSDAVESAPGDWADYGPLTLWGADGLSTSAHEFLRAYAGQMAVINGIAVNSLVHESCSQMVLTGAIGNDHPPDIGARVAALNGADRPLPYLRLGSGARPQELAAQSGEVGFANQLSSLVVPEMAWPVPGTASASPGFVPDAQMREQVDAYLRAGHASLDAARTSPGKNGHKLHDWIDSLAHAEAMRAHTASGGFLGDPGLFETYTPWQRAARALAEGFSQTVFVQDNGYWDTHFQNSNQPGLFSDLFTGIGQLMRELQAAGVQHQTTVLVVSEMGRSPLKNALEGKDHWPYTSAMVIGPGVSPVVVAGTDEGLVQRPVSLTSGEPDAAGRALRTADVLATVSQLVGIDPNELYPGGEVIHAAIA